MGRLGTLQLGAAGLSNLIFFFSTVLFSFLLAVTTPRVAGAKARGEHDEVSDRAQARLQQLASCLASWLTRLVRGCMWELQASHACIQAVKLQMMCSIALLRFVPHACMYTCAVHCDDTVD